MDKQLLHGREVVQTASDTVFLNTAGVRLVSPPGFFVC